MSEEKIEKEEDPNKTGLTKYMKAFLPLGGSNGNGSSNKLMILLFTVLSGIGGAGITTYSKVELNTSKIQGIEEELKEIKTVLKEILRKI